MTIETELKKEEIVLEQFGVEDMIDKVYAVTTDKRVPHPTMKTIQEDAAHKSITIKFITSG